MLYKLADWAHRPDVARPGAGIVGFHRGPLGFGIRPGAEVHPSRRCLARFKSEVSNPSVKRSYTCCSSWRASLRRTFWSLEHRKGKCGPQFQRQRALGASAIEGAHEALPGKLRIGRILDEQELAPDAKHFRNDRKRLIALRPLELLVDYCRNFVAVSCGYQRLREVTAAEQYVPSAGAPTLDGDSASVRSQASPCSLRNATISCAALPQLWKSSSACLWAVPMSSVTNRSAKSKFPICRASEHPPKASAEHNDCGVLQALGFLDRLFEGIHSAIGIALNPENVGQKVAGHDVRIPAGPAEGIVAEKWGSDPAANGRGAGARIRADRPSTAQYPASTPPSPTRWGFPVSRQSGRRDGQISIADRTSPVRM